MSKNLSKKRTEQQTSSEDAAVEEMSMADKRPANQSKSKTKAGGAAQQSLASFFGGLATKKPAEGSEVVLRGPGPSMEAFEDGNVDVWSWNINGINATLERGDIQEFMERNQPTVLCLNETKTDKEKLDQKKFASRLPDGYAQYWNCCTKKKGYSGTAIFTKVRPVWVQFDFGTKHTDEGRSITMEFQQFILVATYVPNSGDNLKRLGYRIDEWDAEFHEYLKMLETTKGKPVLLAGDLNVAHTEIDIYDTKGKEKVPGFSPQERASFTDLLERGFIDTFRHLYPTRVQYSFWSVRQNLRPSNRGWRLDYFLLSSEHQSRYDIELVDSIIDDQQKGSDHCPIVIKMKLPSVASAKAAVEAPDNEKLNLSPEEKGGEATGSQDASGAEELEGNQIHELPTLGSVGKASKQQTAKTPSKQSRRSKSAAPPKKATKKEEVKKPTKAKRHIRRGKSSNED